MAAKSLPPAGNDGLIVLTPEVKEPSVDLVFVHGLTGNRMDTWTKASVMWPRDILAKEESMEKVRIMTWGYNSDIARFWTRTPEEGIDCYARDLCSDLSGKRKETDTANIPIIFVMHSLGGLVCQEALLLGSVHPDEAVKNVGECTRGMVFLGTPFGGSALANWASIALRFAGLLKRLNGRNVEALRKDSEKLAQIGEKFPLLLSQRADSKETKIMMACFYETLPMDIVGKKIVEESSATLAGFRKSSIPQDHSEMCKYTHREDVGYKRVLGVLQEMLAKLESKPDQPSGTTYNGSLTAENVFGMAAGLNLATMKQEGFTYNLGGISGTAAAKPSPHGGKKEGSEPLVEL